MFGFFVSCYGRKQLTETVPFWDFDFGLLWLKTFRVGISASLKRKWVLGGGGRAGRREILVVRCLLPCGHLTSIDHACNSLETAQERSYSKYSLPMIIESPPREKKCRFQISVGGGVGGGGGVPTRSFVFSSGDLGGHAPTPVGYGGGGTHLFLTLSDVISLAN